MAIVEINKRYSALAEESCCLSCGGAIDYSKPMDGEICLDLGSGRGTDVLKMAESVGIKGFVYGIDISDGMIEKARTTADKIKLNNVKFIQSELEKIPLENETVDLIISNCTINHATNKQLVWNEIYRLLKTGGRFVVSDIYSTKPIPDEYRTDPQAISECWGGAVTRVEYFNQLSSAGFTNVEVFEESKPYAKGKVEVVSFTIRGIKKKCCCN
jgi:arsenite methyltransferase